MEADVITVDVRTGVEFLEETKLETISACKIDVEGHAYEVLEGFGDELTRIKSIHVECEVVPVWTDQKLYEDVKSYLESRDYEPFFYIEYNEPTTQSDSIWIHKSVLGKHSWWRDNIFRRPAPRLSE